MLMPDKTGARPLIDEDGMLDPDGIVMRIASTVVRTGKMLGISMIPPMMITGLSLLILLTFIRAVAANVALLAASNIAAETSIFALSNPPHIDGPATA